MDGVFTEPPTGNSLSAFTSNKSSLVQSDEIVSFPFRINTTVACPNGTLAPGSEVFNFALTSAKICPEFLKNFEYWSIQDPKLECQCVAPIGTASGAMMIAQFTDPLNSDIPTDPPTCIEKFGSTLGSVIIRPRDNKCLTIDVSANPMLNNWRYTKVDSTNLRLSSFGSVAGIILDSGALGDGTQYTCWLTGHVLGKRRTTLTGGVAGFLFWNDLKLPLAGPTYQKLNYVESRWVLELVTNASYWNPPTSVFPIELANTFVNFNFLVPRRFDIAVEHTTDVGATVYGITIYVPNLIAKVSNDGKGIYAYLPIDDLSTFPPDSDLSLKVLAEPTFGSAVANYTLETDSKMISLAYRTKNDFIPVKSRFTSITRTHK